MKALILVCLFFLSFNCIAQIEKVGDKVCMSVPEYMKIRGECIKATQKLSVCDTLQLEYDSLVLDQKESMWVKDSVIVELKSKIALKDTVIAYKNITIAGLAPIGPSGNKFKVDRSFFIGVIAGFIGALLLVK